MWCYSSSHVGVVVFRSMLLLFLSVVFFSRGGVFFTWCCCSYCMVLLLISHWCCYLYHMVLLLITHQCYCSFYIICYFFRWCCSFHVNVFACFAWWCSPFHMGVVIYFLGVSLVFSPSCPIQVKVWNTKLIHYSILNSIQVNFYFHSQVFLFYPQFTYVFNVFLYNVFFVVLSFFLRIFIYTQSYSTIIVFFFCKCLRNRSHFVIVCKANKIWQIIECFSSFCYSSQKKFFISN